jgi:DNA-binding FadR family transcriptional regulator
LREALRVLESEGFIKIRRGGNGGAQAQLPTDAIASRYFGALLQSQQTTLADAFQARTIIEAPAAGMAAANWSQEGLDELRRHIKLAEEAYADPAALWDACNEFHRVVIEVAGNSTLRLMSGLLDRILDRAACAFALGEFIPELPNTPYVQPGVSPGHRTHVKLLELIEKRDAKRAEQLWRKHLTQAAEAVLNAPGAKTVVELMSSTA